MAEKLSRKLYGKRMLRIANIMRDQPSASQADALYEELVRLKFDDVEFEIACEDIIETCRRYPYAADFVEARRNALG